MERVVFLSVLSMCCVFLNGGPGKKGYAASQELPTVRTKSEGVLQVTSEDKAIVVEAYWGRPGKKGQNSAVYMTLQTGADLEGNALVKATSSLCREVQIHTVLEEEINGTVVKKMRQIDGIKIPPHQVVSLVPGGYHIMLIELARDLVPGVGDTLDMTLFFEKGQKISLVVPIKKKPCTCCKDVPQKAAVI